ncbi:MAG TPA: aspartate-semialdehyde dehydrogenase [Gemmatimonadales bacterium]|nr:aspartate-semialdehyde dehydrogenase [Gemmatimonadales bacterium]
MKELRLRVGVLGATGAVGQRFVQLLAGHPWFDLAALAASERSAGRSYAEAVSWRLDVPIPVAARDLPVLPAEPGFECDIVFSALDAAVAGPIEEAFAKAGYAVLSNSRNHRMDEDVPLLVPEVNADHTALIAVQKKRRGWKGFIATNPNCSTATLTLALAPLERRFGLRSVAVTTLQAVSGAGYPGIPSLDILGNVVPFIAGEEEKIERETRKILGRRSGDTVTFHPMVVSAQTTRVPVVDGHTESVFVSLEKKADLEAVREAFRTFSGPPQQLGLPSAPAHPTVLLDEPDRPQPRLDINVERGMATLVGRVRPCELLGWKFIALGHNTIRGAAGAAILNAELLQAQGILSR